MKHKQDLIDQLYDEILVLHKRMPWISLHDINYEDFQEKHWEVINSDEDPEAIGNYLIMHYYNNVWNSRSESEIMVNNLHIRGDYSVFYCSWNAYEYINAESLLKLRDLDRNDYERRKSKIKSEANNEAY